MALEPDIVRATVAAIDAAFAGLRPPGDARLLHPQCMDDGDVMDFHGTPDRRRLSADSGIAGSSAFGLAGRI